LSGIFPNGEGFAPGAAPAIAVAITYIASLMVGHAAMQFQLPDLQETIVWRARPRIEIKEMLKKPNITGHRRIRFPLLD